MHRGGFAQALAATGVTVNAVLPGPTRTEGVDDMFRSMGQSAADPKAQREFIDKTRPSSIIKGWSNRKRSPKWSLFWCRAKPPLFPALRSALTAASCSPSHEDLRDQRRVPERREPI